MVSGMKTEKDFEDLLRLFNKNKVRYCIVGAYAMAFYARPRFTKDMDILVEPDQANACRILKSLKEFGFKSLDLKEKDFTKIGVIIQLGYEPFRIDLITSIEGCSFKEVWRSRVKGAYGRQKVNFIGLKELIKNKRSSNRKQDQADIALLSSKPIGSK
jgi:hypothetical protein